jgi:hypothetical protein
MENFKKTKKARCYTRPGLCPWFDYFLRRQ